MVVVRCLDYIWRTAWKWKRGMAGVGDGWVCVRHCGGGEMGDGDVHDGCDGVGWVLLLLLSMAADEMGDGQGLCTFIRLCYIVQKEGRATVVGLHFSGPRCLFCSFCLDS